MKKASKKSPARKRSKGEKTVKGDDSVAQVAQAESNQSSGGKEVLESMQSVDSSSPVPRSPFPDVNFDVIGSPALFALVSSPSGPAQGAPPIPNSLDWTPYMRKLMGSGGGSMGAIAGGLGDINACPPDNFPFPDIALSPQLPRHSRKQSHLHHLLSQGKGSSTSSRSVMGNNGGGEHGAAAGVESRGKGKGKKANKGEGVAFCAESYDADCSIFFLSPGTGMAADGSGVLGVGGDVVSSEFYRDIMLKQQQQGNPFLDCGDEEEEDPEMDSESHQHFMDNKKFLNDRIGGGFASPSSSAETDHSFSSSSHGHSTGAGGGAGGIIGCSSSYQGGGRGRTSSSLTTLSSSGEGLPIPTAPGTESTAASNKSKSKTKTPKAPKAPKEPKEPKAPKAPKVSKVPKSGSATKRKASTTMGEGGEGVEGTTAVCSPADGGISTPAATRKRVQKASASSGGTGSSGSNDGSARKSKARTQKANSKNGAAVAINSTSEGLIQGQEGGDMAGVFELINYDEDMTRQGFGQQFTGQVDARVLALHRQQQEERSELQSMDSNSQSFLGASQESNSSEESMGTNAVYQAALITLNRQSQQSQDAKTGGVSGAAISYGAVRGSSSGSPSGMPVPLSGVSTAVAGSTELFRAPSFVPSSTTAFVSMSSLNINGSTEGGSSALSATGGGGYGAHISAHIPISTPAMMPGRGGGGTVLASAPVPTPATVAAATGSAKTIRDSAAAIQPPAANPSKYLSPATTGNHRVDVHSANTDKSSNIICNCKRTRCLKMYCDCFRFSVLCKEMCNCQSCLNMSEETPERKQAIATITDRKPDAFKPRVQEDVSSNSKGHLTGCHCRKSNCLKKYCECFTGGAPCVDRCRCIDCKNVPSLYLPGTSTASVSVSGVGSGINTTGSRYPFSAASDATSTACFSTAEAPPPAVYKAAKAQAKNSFNKADSSRIMSAVNTPLVSAPGERAWQGHGQLHFQRQPQQQPQQQQQQQQPGQLYKQQQPTATPAVGTSTTTTTTNAAAVAASAVIASAAPRLMPDSAPAVADKVQAKQQGQPPLESHPMDVSPTVNKVLAKEQDQPQLEAQSMDVTD